MNVVQRAMLRRVVRFAQSGQGQRIMATGRARLDTPANRARVQGAAGQLWQRLDTPANNARLAELARRLRSGGAAGR